MSLPKTVFSVFIGSVFLLVPLISAHAQVVYGNTYGGGYYSTGYNNSYNYSSNYNTNEYPYQNRPYSYRPYTSYSYEPLPQCTITLTTENTYYGSGAPGTLNWTSTNASSAYISGIGEVNPWSGTQVYAYPNEVFTLTVSNQRGSSTCQTEYYGPQYQSYYQPYLNQYPTYGYAPYN
jgi:hypothetical protein